MKDERPNNRDYLQEYRKSVRVFGIRKKQFLEFSFTLECEELTIELVMRYREFKKFCETNHVAEITCDRRVKSEFDRLAAGEFPKLHQELKPKDQDNIIQLGDFK